MNTKEIDEVLARIIDPDKTNFVGVFAKDLIPPLKEIDKFPACLVLNSDESGQPGSHWLALYYNSPNSCEFFDSYGIEPEMYDLPKDHFPSQLLFNSTQIQCPLTSVCGAHCIYFLYQRCLGYTMPHIVSQFSESNLRGNDLFVSHYVNKLLAKPIKFRICHTSTPNLLFQKSHARAH